MTIFNCKLYKIPYTYTFRFYKLLPTVDLIFCKILLTAFGFNKKKMHNVSIDSDFQPLACPRCAHIKLFGKFKNKEII